MSENTYAIKNSFFKGYFFYKFRNLRGFTILFTVLNFLTTAGFAAGIMIFEKILIALDENSISYDSYYGGYELLYFITLLIYLMIALIFVTVFMLSVMPAVNFRYFNKRTYMDTLGGLPITGRQRFFGDVLSGAAAFGISFVPSSLLAVIFAAITESNLWKISDEYADMYIIQKAGGSYINLVLTFLLTMLLCYAAAYVISCFVSSCCGKVGTSVLFSLITMGALVLIPLSVGGLIVDNTIGFDAEMYDVMIASSMPPFGTIISTIMETRSEYDNLVYAVRTPLVTVILLVTALFGFGAYLASKHRKTERVERELVFNAAYYVIPAIITFTACTFCIRIEGAQKAIIPLALISLGTCLVMAFLNERSLKKLWKGAVVFTAAVLVAFGLGKIIEATKGFGISTRIPSKNSIRSITLEGDAIFETFNDLDITVESDAGISLVLSENKIFVENLDDFSYSGGRRRNPLRITYNLKNGLTVHRSYTYIPAVESKSDDPRYRLAHKLIELPEFESKTLLGIMNSPDIPCTGIVFNGNIFAPEEYNSTLFVKPEKYEEFVKCFTEDFLNYDPLQPDSAFGIMVYKYLDTRGVPHSISNGIWGQFSKTLEFLRDPDNFEEEPNIAIDDKTVYYVNFSGDNSRLYTIYHPELAPELLSYFEPENAINEDDISPYFYIISSTNDGNYNYGNSFYIRRENEQAALSAFIKAIRADTQNKPANSVIIKPR